MTIKKTTDKTIQQQALDLALLVFMEFEAPDYSNEGIEEFKRSLQNPAYVDNLCFYVAIEQEEIIGMMATRNNGSHLALLFVDGLWQRKGVGRKLIESALENCECSAMTVNSAPFAHEFYKKVGFEDTDVEQVTNGIRYFPMKIYHTSCTLRTFVYEDATTILGWCKTKREFRLWSADRYKSFPASADEMMMQYKGCNMFPLTMVEGGRSVGHILLRYPSCDKDVIRFGFVIIDDVLRGKGYGKTLLKLAIDYARDILHAKRITLGVFCDNHSAFECYRSVGFTAIDNDSYMIDGEEWRGYEMEHII